MKKKNLFLVMLTILLILIIGCVEKSPLTEEELRDYECEKSRCKESIQCNEYEYWEEVSDEFPYPGMNCDEGPIKTIGVTAFVAKEPGSDEHVKPTIFYKETKTEIDATEQGYTMEDAAEGLISDLNTEFNPHGIGFVLRDVIYTNGESPKILDKLNVINYFENVFEGQYNPNDLNVIFLPDYDVFYTSSASHPWNIKEKFGKPRALSLDNWVNQPYDGMVHEIGHFFGLLHTFWDKGTEDFSIRGLYWANPAQECHKEGDYVCDTPFDCHPVEEQKGACKMDEVTKENYPYSIMAYRGGTSEFSKEQGARARYYLMYRLNNNINGNTIKEFYG